jgi:hypothetical protein
LIVRPTPRFAAGDKLAVHLARVEQRGWLARWPHLRTVSC